MNWLVEIPWLIVSKTFKLVFNELKFYVSSFISGFKYGFTYTPILDFCIFNLFNPLKNRLSSANPLAHTPGARRRPPAEDRAALLAAA